MVINEQINCTSETLPSLAHFFVSPSGTGIDLQFSGSFLLHRWQRKKSSDVYPQK
jgi:hypothetical protein